jgi:hypothetical protein
MLSLPFTTAKLGAAAKATTPTNTANITLAVFFIFFLFD